MDRLLCSINDRLEAVLWPQGLSVIPGQTLDPLSGAWIEEMQGLLLLDVKYERDRKKNKGHGPSEDELDEIFEEW